ncbi:MAG TPA: DUF2490 domain-containing protein, partial [Bacteroidia bacterium]|nr:DUF2490 domain-containing protein [Bacteroidia bacterium]
MKRFLFIAFIFISVSAAAQSAPVVQTRRMIWTTAAAEYRFRSNWSWVSDANFRFEPVDGDIFQWCVRSGISYKTKTGITITGGLVYFQHYAN